MNILLKSFAEEHFSGLNILASMTDGVMKLSIFYVECTDAYTMLLVRSTESYGNSTEYLTYWRATRLPHSSGPTLHHTSDGWAPFFSSLLMF